MIRSQFNIPVIYLTAYSDEETLRRAKLTESYGFISKPFEEKELYVAIEFALYKHQLHSKVMEQASWMEALLRSFPEAFLALDRDQRVAFLNPQTEKILGVTEAEIKGRPIGDFVSVPLLSGEPSGEQSLDWQSLSGSRLPLLVRQQPIHDAKGVAMGQLLLVKSRTV
jgi:PAS domain S-box-containing protein